ncbi:MAG: CopD family protein [Bdellovibrionota bacterium]
MYLVFKWFHIIAVISWMCGILYLFRLFVYHSEKGRNNNDIHELLALMEFRLFRYITVPAMAVAWIAGISIIISMPSLASGGWLHGKILFVIALTFITFKAGKMRKSFADINAQVPSSKKLRIMNEVPTILMLIIVALVVFKPF